LFKLLWKREFFCLSIDISWIGIKKYSQNTAKHSYRRVNTLSTVFGGG